MTGMDRATGRALDSDAHLRQSIADILCTPLGSRVMRRDYGSRLPELIDQALNEATRTRIYGATATALQRWEPRVRVRRIQLEPGARPGAAELTLTVERIDPGGRRVPASLSVPLPLRLFP
ncbi:GPW/gp25 family protein [Lysobacter sp. K5869]|uniref:GPW/gp25 family protein n=1 Tax=Lysobacter sp. K5869 TaxID=2820808 RepID=UPI001C06460F|nr:GPW/gp25 family protein [Lysobacter sp. K5869]QWP76079.1 GPW/gp25 family protein [Lysobacter sp. K5869]